jgi:signal transduction histidine kinase/CheY-like chemotaxis protein
MKRQAIDRMKGKAGIYEVQMFKKDGSRMWVMISGAPIYNKWGAVVGTIGIHYDVTKQKQLQQELFEARLRAESAQEAEKQFLANMSHEIRTPLNAIIGMTHLLFDTKPSTEQQNYLEVLKSSSVILQSLINDLLDISKIKAGKMEVHPKEFDLAGLVRTIQKTFQIKLENKPVEVGAEIDHHLNTIFIGDDLMLNQILLNLLGNAEKFTPEGKIGIRVTQKERVANEVTIQFEVYDTGIGIPKDKIDLIFQSFRQVDGDIKRRFGGTGLGLSIVKNLVELQGGTLSVDSQEGTGTIFTFLLTYKDTGLMPVKSVAVPKAFDSFCAHECKVLVVEDNSMNRRYLGSLLDKWGILYDVAINGKEGFEMAQLHPYSLIFMDIQMPIMDGYEAAIAIRSTVNPNQETPILALTASAMLSRKDKAFQVGMNGYVSKPFTPEQLLETLAQFIQLQKINDPASSETVELAAQEKDGEFAFSPDLDAERLHDLYGSDAEYALDMFDAFFEKIEKEYPQLAVLLQKGELAALSKMAHKLKPTFPMVGLTSMERYFQQLEDEAQDPSAQPALIQSIFNDIDQKLAEVLPLAETERARLRSLCSTVV